MVVTSQLSKAEKDVLFDRIITGNAPNKFVFSQLEQSLFNNPAMIVPFVGAGISTFSYKAWGSLLQDLLDQLADQEIDAPKRSEIQSQISKGDFFLAADNLESLIESDVFYFSLVSAYNENILINDGIPSNAAVKWLPRVFPESRIITTNYDCVLEFAYAQERKYLRVCTPSDSRMFFQFMPRRLFKIHGSYDSNYEDIVLTAKSYNEKYNKTGLLYNNFKHVVQSSILFFIGASLRSDRTLDILKEIAIEFTIGGHYCGSMHYALVNIDSDGDKIRRRQELAEYKILPILYSATDHDGYEDKHAIVGIILEKLYSEVEKSFLRKIPSITSNRNEYRIEDSSSIPRIVALDKTASPPVEAVSPDTIDGHFIAQLLKQDPMNAFAFALKKNNLGLAENMISTLEQALPREVYITKVVSALASRGSSLAANILISEVSDNFHGDFSTAQKIDIGGSLVSYCNRQDKEIEYLGVLDSLLRGALQDATPTEQASIFNQLSRLYHGAYKTTKEEKADYLSQAIQFLKQAIQLDSAEPSYFYNLAVAEKDIDLNAAKEAITKCVDLETNDLDHLSMAYRIYRADNDDRAKDILGLIQLKNPMTAKMIQDLDD